MRLLCIAIGAALVSVPSFGTPPKTSVAPLHGAIRIDGNLDDIGWRDATRLTTFYEYWTTDNQTPPVQTTALVAFDAKALYVAFEAFDPKPGAIRAPLVDRDGVGADQDFVEVLLDTRGDRHAASRFRVNAAGIQTDGVLNDATGSEDLAPDFFFDAAAHTTPTGWTAELRIPFASLRYDAREKQDWGWILTRNYPRAFRYAMASAPIPKSSSCFVCHAGLLDGLTNLPRSGHINVAPYIAQSSGAQSNNAGLDVKWSPAPEMAFDATLRPDFSQVEADAPQITANARFALDYPEKRPFFLEGGDFLATLTRVVNTRAITNPLWGARLTGQHGDTAYAMVAAEDRGGGVVILPGPLSSTSLPQDSQSRVLITRLRRTFGSSFAGLIATAREVDGGGHNRVLGPDVHWVPSNATRIDGQLLMSDTKERDGTGARGHVADVRYTGSTRTWTTYAGAREVSSHFRADDGFVPQAGYRAVYTELDHNAYPSGFLSMFQWWLGAERFYSSDSGKLLRQDTYPGFMLHGRWNSAAAFGLHPLQGEQVGDRFLRTSNFSYSIMANPWSWAPVLMIDGTYGGKIDYASGRRGRGGSMNVTASIRADDRLAFDISRRNDWLRGGFDASAARLKVTYAFSPRMRVRLIGQKSDGSSVSALFAYQLNWQSSLYAGYGDAPAFDDGEVRAIRRRSYFVKMSYALRY